MLTYNGPHGLLHETEGYSARYVLGRLGYDQTYKVRALNQRVSSLERLLVLRLRGFRGIRLERHDVEIVPGADGWLAFRTDASCEFTPLPGTPHTALLSVTPGCAAAITTNIDCDAGTVTATACGATVEHISGNDYVAVHVAGTANAQTLTYWWCAPASPAPPGYIGGDTWYSQLGPPIGFVKLEVGDPCTGGCSSIAVPYWAPGAP